MEPGHEDREYNQAPMMTPKITAPQWSPVMKTGNTSIALSDGTSFSGLNGARS